MRSKMLHQFRLIPTIGLLTLVTMSGGGGSGYVGGGSSAGTSCNIVEAVPLNSPKASVISKLKVGDELDVVLQVKSLIARAQSHGAAGSLTPKSLAALIECIEKGHEYIAKVIKLSGGACEVEIRPK
jgi:hypothetical protein